MDIPVKKLQNGFSLPVYGLGLWEMGGRRETDTSRDEIEIKAIRAALEAGVTHIDTAEMYGDGHAEELLKLALQGYDRSKLIIASKVSAWNQSYTDLHNSFNASLERTGLDYLDLYLLHRFPEPGIEIKETMRAMNELVEQGLVKNIGVSNMTPARFEEAQKYCDSKIVCNQVHYNVQYREVEDKDILSDCQDRDTFLVAWRPLQKGLLPQSDLLNTLADKYNKTVAQVAINWLVSQNNVVVIAKTSNREHLKENLGALDWKMNADDIELIRLNFSEQKLVSDAVPLDYKADIKP